MSEMNIDAFNKKREKWQQLVESEEINAPKITDSHMKGVVYQILENTERELNEATQTGDIAQYTPVLMSLIRRTMPSLVGNQMVGVQSMSAPTGRIFAQHVYYGSNKTSGTETWANGAVRTTIAIGAAPNENHTGPYNTAKGEALGWQDGAVTIPSTDLDGSSISSATKTNSVANTEGSAWPEMSFAIDYIDVSVKTRALKGKLTTEVISDLRAVHGLDAEQEIANILQAEIVAEIDREIINRINAEAKVGAQKCNTAGVFDFAVDADGRWSMEKVQGLLIQIEREATLIAQETRRGRGNFILTSPEVAAWLSMANLITNEYGNVGFTPVVNPVGISYYGTLTNRFKVYVDPYATSDDGKHYLTVGYKGANAYDAGIFYCPYIPLQFFKAQGQEDFGLRLGIKSRYGLVSNPYYCASTSSTPTEAAAHTNSYYRRFAVKFSS